MKEGLFIYPLIRTTNKLMCKIYTAANYATNMLIPNVSSRYLFLNKSSHEYFDGKETYFTLLLFPSLIVYVHISDECKIIATHVTM